MFLLKYRDKSSPKLSRVLYKSIATRSTYFLFLLENTAKRLKKENNLLTLISKCKFSLLILLDCLKPKYRLAGIFFFFQENSQFFFCWQKLFSTFKKNKRFTPSLVYNKIGNLRRRIPVPAIYMWQCALKNQVYNNSCYSYSMRCKSMGWVFCNLTN